MGVKIAVNTWSHSRPVSRICLFFLFLFFLFFCSKTSNFSFLPTDKSTSDSCWITLNQIVFTIFRLVQNLKRNFVCCSKLFTLTRMRSLFLCAIQTEIRLCSPFSDWFWTETRISLGAKWIGNWWIQSDLGWFNENQKRAILSRNAMRFCSSHRLQKKKPSKSEEKKPSEV